MATLGAAAVADDVRGDAEQPRELLAARQLLVDSPPGLEEDDRDEILGDGPAPNAAEAVVVIVRPWRSKSTPNASESPERARDHRTESSTSIAWSCPTRRGGFPARPSALITSARYLVGPSIAVLLAIGSHGRAVGFGPVQTRDSRRYGPIAVRVLCADVGKCEVGRRSGQVLERQGSA